MRFDKGEAIEVFSETQRFFCPEVRVAKREPSHRYVTLRGCAYSLAVFDGEDCIGYVMSDDLGFESAADLVKANHPQLLKDAPAGRQI